MNIEVLEFRDAKLELRGVLTPGILKFTFQGGSFGNSKTRKVLQMPSTEWDSVFWIRIAGGFGLKFFLNNGQMHRFAGFVDKEFEELRAYMKKNYQIELRPEEKSVKGWNWGSVKFNGSVMGFNVERQTAFDIPLSYVSQCTTQKNEAILEFHPNDDASVSLMEMRFYIPQEGAEGDPVESFHQNVMSKADIIQATGDALLSLQEVPSLTPRGRYELKVYPTFLQLHGKTFDYKIPYNSILRVFILPHPDNRQMFFVLSLDPPIKQGQTRYPFLILNFKKDEDPLEIDLDITEEELKTKYDGRLEKHVAGQTYEVLGRVLRGLINRRITVPGQFKGASGSSAISCSYKAAAGVLYPLDRGFIYVHKPALHVRDDEVAAVNFARSGGNTRSFDFEIETKNGITHTFSSIQKEEYSRLFDFVTAKGLRVKNRGEKEDVNPRKNLDEILDSDVESEHDAYLEQVKKEGAQRDMDEDEEDEDFKPPSETSDVAEEFDSEASSSSEDEEGEGGEKKPKKKKEKRRHREEEVGDDERKKADKAKKAKSKEAKKTKDPDQPKKPLSAYIIFTNENREKVKTENPGITITDISKKMGEMWKSLTEAGKKKYDELAVAAKEEYQKKMVEWEKTKRNRDAAESDNDKGGKRKKDEGAKKKTSTGASTSKASPMKIKSAEFVDTDTSSSSSSEAEQKKEKETAKAKKPKKDEKPAAKSDKRAKTPVELSSDDSD